MSFEEVETSRSLGEPNTLFRFSIGLAVYAYTDSELPVTFNGTQYAPLPISYDSITSSGTLDKSALSVTMPGDTPVATLFEVFPPTEVISLTIFQGHANDDSGQYLAIWAGRVLSAKWEDPEAVLNCEPVSTSMRRLGLRTRDQYQCMHAVYGPSCRADRGSFTRAGVVATVSGNKLTLTSGWNADIAKDRFVNGILAWDKFGHVQQLQILKVDADANRLTIGGLMGELAPGDSVSLTRGCNHNMSDCNEFNNIQNFGGCGFIPKVNPVGFRNSFF